MTQPWFGYLFYRGSMLFFLSFLLLFLELRYHWAISIGITAVCYAITAALDYCTYFVWHRDGAALWMTLVQIVIVQGTAFLLSEYRDSRALFTGVTASTYVLAGNIVTAILQIFWLSWPAALAIGAAVQLILLLIFVKLLRPYYLAEMRAGNRSWALLTVLPALFYTAMYALTAWPSSLRVVKTNWVAALVLLALLAASYLLLIKMYSRQRTESELQQSQKLLDSYAKSLRHELETVRRAETRLAACRHDMRHVDRLLLNYLEKGETEKAKELLAEQEKSLSGAHNRHYCENVAIDGILANSAAAAEEKQIDFVCRASVPAELNSVNEFELGIVVLNLLENALQAAAEVADPAQRQVTVRIFPVKAQLMVEIANYFAGSRCLSEKTGLPETSQGSGHGYGLQNVQAFAEKNNAFFKISVTGEEFKVQLMVKA